MHKVTSIEHNPAWQALLGSQLWQHSERVSQERISTGCQLLDDSLPGAGGITRGSLIEWLGNGAATYCAIVAAREAAQDGGLIAFVDRARTFYPPAAVALGIDFDRAVIIRPSNEKDELWAMDQVLRCAHVAAVIGWPKKIDSITFRRFQLAAERSGCVGLLVRPSAATREPSWADLRVSVSPHTIADDVQSHWNITLKILRCRGNVHQEELTLQIDDRTGDIHEAHVSHLATQLAHPKVTASTKRASA